MIQPAAAWRDGPEFVTSAWTLGISHPAGYPLYQSLNWIFEQLPLGDILLRNHVSCVFLTTVAAILLYHLVLSFIRLISPSHDMDPRSKLIAGWISLSWMIMPAQMENAIQSEVYSLYAILTFLVCILLFGFLRTRETRRYILAVFIAGVGVGNHATLGAILFAFIVAVGIMPTSAAYIKTALSGVVAGVYGLLVYLYLPVRSLNDPIYDWGNPETLQRFLHHVLDKKDESSHMEQAADLIIQTDTNAFIQHVLAFYDVVGPVGLLLPLAGWLWLLLRHTRVALTCLSWSVFLYLFFLDWYSDTVLTGVLGIYFLGFVPFWLFLIEHASSTSLWRRLLTLGAAAGIAGTIFLNIFQSGVSFLAHRATYLPKEMVEHELLAVPYRATVLASLDMFHLKYLSAIDGMRPDVTIIGLGDIIAPLNFKPLKASHIPLLQYPKHGIPADRSTNIGESGKFIGDLLRANADRSTFYYEMEEEQVMDFLPQIRPAGSIWARLDLSPAPKMSGREYCSQISETVRHMLKPSLDESNATLDKEAGWMLQGPFLAWADIALRGTPACPNIGKNMLVWWLHWMDTSQIAMNNYYNTIGLMFSLSGADRGARTMFQISHDMGGVQGALNLAAWYEIHHDESRAADIYRKTFLKSGSHKAFVNYRRLILGKKAEDNP